MRTIIAGSRGITDPAHLTAALASCPWAAYITEVVSGACEGPDRLGEAWAEAAALPVSRFPANWRAHGRAAGPRRNAEMAAYADALVALYDGQSRGTAHMIRTARAVGLPVHVHYSQSDA